MHSLKRTVASAVALAAAAGLTAGTAAAEPIKLGQITSLTGTNAVVGQDMKRGMELAVQRVNNGYEVPMDDGESRKLGPELLDGRQVKVIVENTESRPASAMDATRKLVNVDDVPVVVGEFSSGISVPTGQFTNKNQTVQISVGSTSPKLADIGPYMFNAIGLDDIMGAKLAEFAMEDSGAKNFASITPNNPFGVGLELNACKTVKNAGGKCVNTVRYELNKSDYRPEIKQLFRGNAEAGFYTAYGTESRLIFRQMYEMGKEMPKGWYADYMTMWSNEVKEIPQVAEGVKGLVVGVDSNFYDTEYAQAYDEAYGEAPLTAFGGYAYDAAMLAMLAIDEAGSTKPKQIAEALHEVADDYKGVTGDKAVDENGMQKRESYQRKIYKDGKLQDYSVSSS
jgi:branched-chain amino acid transport system substrate-binding protein